MQKPSLGWQSWSPPFRAWYGYPRWDYPPLPTTTHQPAYPKSILGQTIRYWCSWYAYGKNINHQKIAATLTLIRKFDLAFTHILLDDGWTTWGDWQTPSLPKFPNMVSTIKLIKSQHLQAGLWFAPFLASPKSHLFKEHPNWFILYKNHPVQGLKTYPLLETLGPQQYLLNFALPPVRGYITDFIELAVKTWGISLFKLDFLFAPYFNPNLTSDKLPRSQIVWLLTHLKKHYPHVITIACGAPFAPTLGLADIVRISKDTALPPPAPTILNRFFYVRRVSMLAQKLSSPGLPLKPSFDPDVRISSLDTSLTSSIWDTIRLNTLGVGDNLTKLSSTKLQTIKIWLNNHRSQRQSLF